MIQNCDDVGATVGLNIGGVIVTYDEPTAIDNSGTVNLASRTRSPGQFFVVGSTAVTYRFVDGSGNFAECTFNVIVTEGKRILLMSSPSWNFVIAPIDHPNIQARIFSLRDMEMHFKKCGDCFNCIY